MILFVPSIQSIKKIPFIEIKYSNVEKNKKALLYLIPSTFKSNDTVITFPKNINEIAKWYSQISYEKITPDFKKFIKSQFSNDTNPAYSVFKYSSNEIKYFSFYTGYESIKPRPITDIIKTKYGDCKDKSKLLKTILTELGYNSNYALVQVNDEIPFDIRYPLIGAFDHIIVWVEINDSIFWLDPVRNEWRFGKIPFPLQNKLALKINNSSSELIRLPCDKPDDNEIIISIVSKLSSPDTLNFIIQIESKGESAHLFKDWFNNSNLSFWDGFPVFANKFVNFKNDTLQIKIEGILLTPISSLGNKSSISIPFFLKLVLNKNFTPFFPLVYKENAIIDSLYCFYKISLPDSIKIENDDWKLERKFWQYENSFAWFRKIEIINIKNSKEFFNSMVKENQLHALLECK